MIYSDIDYIQLEKLANGLKYKTVSTSLLKDIQDKNLQWRLEKLTPTKYTEDDILHFYVYNKIVDAWSNLLREWFTIGIRKDITTYLYWARVKYHPKHIKIGITYDVGKRSNFPNNRYYDYHVIRWCKNRFACAYLEYKIRTLYCIKNTETIDVKQLNDVIDFANGFHWKKEMKEELELLGWNFEK